jgi:glycosyltransferase involved in cell wall biosynthesis
MILRAAPIAPTAPETILSVIVPARNEEALIAGTLGALVAAAARFEQCPPDQLDLARGRVEVLVVDNLSSDGTREALAPFVARHGVRVVSSARLRAPCARNDGVRAARGRILVFVDADTLVPPDFLVRVRRACDTDGIGAGITRLAPRDGGLRAWWAFWEQVRRLPLARAKAMPACMYCTREVFAAYGPFDETVEIGEEWPILAELYREQPSRLRYDRSLTARTSSRRMELQRSGYARVFLRYVWAVLHASGRTGYGDEHRHREAARR